MPIKETTAILKVSKEDDIIIRLIAKRAYALIQKHSDTPLCFDTTDLELDLIATHANGCPLRLAELLVADDFNLLRDVCGIQRHLNRYTGKLRGHFLPRFAKPQPR